MGSEVVDLVHDFSMGISRGTIPRYSFLSKMGRHSLASTSYESLWSEGGIYNFPLVSSTMKVASDSANDNSSGVGARKVIVEGLDSEWNYIKQEVSLNGLTEVELPTDLIRVFRAYCTEVGTNGVNSGNIYIGTGVFVDGKPLNVFAKLDMGFGQTLMGVYTIPKGKKGYLTRLYFSCEKGKGLKMRFFRRNFQESWRVLHTASIHENLYDHKFVIPEYLPEKTDVEIQVITDAGFTDSSGGFEIILVDDEV